MGMPCEVNSLLKLSRSQGYPARLEVGDRHTVHKTGYRILPMDVPILLVDADWLAHADIKIVSLTWAANMTHIEFEITRLYAAPFATQ